MLAVVDDPAGSRQGARLVKHQPQSGILDPPYPAGIDAMPARLPVDDAAERPLREPRHPSDPAPEPREQAADIELAAADPDLEEPRLVEPLLAGGRQPQQCFAERQQIIAAVGRKAHPNGPGLVSVNCKANAGRPRLSKALRHDLICVLAEAGSGDDALEFAAHQGLTRRLVAAP